MAFWAKWSFLVRDCPVLCRCSATSLAPSHWMPMVSPLPYCDHQNVSKCPLGGKLRSVGNHCNRAAESKSAADLFQNPPGLTNNLHSLGRTWCLGPLRRACFTLHHHVSLHAYQEYTVFVPHLFMLVGLILISNQTWCKGFLGGAVVKKLSANAGGSRDLGSIPASGRSPGVGNGTPTVAWWDTVHGVAKNRTWQSNWAHTNMYKYWKVLVSRKTELGSLERLKMTSSLSMKQCRLPYHLAKDAAAIKPPHYSCSDQTQETDRMPAVQQEAAALTSVSVLGGDSRWGRKDTGHTELRCTSKEWFQWAQTLASFQGLRRTEFLSLRYLVFFNRNLSMFWLPSLCCKNSDISWLLFGAVPQSYLRGCILGLSLQFHLPNET